MTASLTPAIKGQLTKAANIDAVHNHGQHGSRYGFAFNRVRTVFERIMPREQAKHAARRYLAARQGGAQ
jgi:hypothetical protein